MAMSASYPVRLGFQADTHVHRWRPLVQWLLAIPQFIIVSALRTVRGALTVIAFFTVLFTKQVPRSIFDVIVMTHRYEWRVVSYALFLREDYPPFDFTLSSEDDGLDHASVSVEYPTELNRWMPLVKWLLAIPQILMVVLLAVAGFFLVVAGFFAVLFTGEYPPFLRDTLVGIYRYELRVEAYVGLLTDRYPPFELTG